MTIQCDCFCRNKPINKFYPKFRQSCAQCTLDLCTKNNTKGFAGWCLFGKRAIHCSEYNSIPPISIF
ncbi:unnamed protein product [Rotaria sp. Silwood2]|nr:unnamed protein product [Rotaria sp. Silwood2]